VSSDVPTRQDLEGGESYSLVVMSARRALAIALSLLAVAACSNPTPKPAATATPGRSAPALVQVENAPDSRPHSGLQKADIVYEYLTEGGITRFTVIYLKPAGSEKIGPVRSARLVALRLVKSYQGVLFYSGASDHVLGIIKDTNVPALDENADGGKYFTRDPSRQAPHNLYTGGDQLKAGLDKVGAKVTYQLPASREPAGQGDPVAGISFDQTFAHPVKYTYAAAEKTYAYTTDTGVEVDKANGNQPLKITNVVLLQVAHHTAGYTEDVRGEQGIDFDLQGTGPVDVYTRGLHFTATWDLSAPDRPLRLTGADGKDFALPPGLTWINLVDPGTKPTTS
jgi:hypothetical protein